MNVPGSWRLATVLTIALGLGGCQTVKPYDFSNFRAHPPRSILVLPPLNESTAVEGTYGYLTTVNRPVAERGYYVFPIAVVDQLMKDNGLPTAAEMQQAPLTKVAQITGADAVLFLDLKQYGAHYQLLSSTVVVEVAAKLVDTHRPAAMGGPRHGPTSFQWLGEHSRRPARRRDYQAINKKSDRAHQVSRLANANLFFPEQTGLPCGPYSPKYDKTP
jgi:hypothetical protein